MATPRNEQETTVTWLRSEDVVRIYTTITADLKALRSNEKATQVRGDEEWGEFTIKATDFKPLKGFTRKRKMTEEQKDALRKRLKAMKESKA